MAYLDLTFASGAAGAAVATTTTTRTATGLSRLERQVVQLARQDTVSSLSASSWVQRAGKTLFGIEFARPLADERLEALRKFAVRTARGRNTETEEARLLDLGFDAEGVDEARSIASRYRSEKGWDHVRTVLVAIATILGFGAFQWLRSQIGDSLVSAIILVVFALPFVSFLSSGRGPRGARSY